MGASTSGWTAWCALACALGAWLRPSLSALSCLALWCLPRALALAPDTVPGGGLPEALRALERGLVPSGPDASDVLIAASACVLGLALFRRSAP